MSWSAMPELAAGVVAVLAVFLALVGALLLFERRFAPHGAVHIAIEGGAGFDCEPGDSLHAVLRDHGILLPSGCAGAGTCGLCRICVVRGGDEALPSERVHFTRAELRAGWRLACQLRVRDDLELALPAQALAARRLTCTVTAVRDVATFIRELTFALPPDEPFACPAGSFVQIEIPAYRGLRFVDFGVDERRLPAWRSTGALALVADNAAPTTRAYSLANPPAQADALVLNVRIATPPPGSGLPPGVGSSYLYGLRPGDAVTLSGPFGDFHVDDSDREMIYIGGGAGMAPLRSHILHLLRELGSQRRISYWYGARSRDELFYTEQFEQLAREHPNFSFHVALSEPLPDDQWTGDVGFIHQVVHDRHLAGHDAVDQISFYLCGPPAMLTATRRMLDELGVAPDRIAFDDFGGQEARP